MDVSLNESVDGVSQSAGAQSPCKTARITDTWRLVVPQQHLVSPRNAVVKPPSEASKLVSGSSGCRSCLLVSFYSLFLCGMYRFFYSDFDIGSVTHLKFNKEHLCILSIYLFVRLYVCLFIYLYIYLSIYLHI